MNLNLNAVIKLKGRVEISYIIINENHISTESIRLYYYGTGNAKEKGNKLERRWCYSQYHYEPERGRQN